MRSTTEESVSIRVQMQSMGEEITRAKGSAASMATMGQQSNVTTEPVGMTKKKTTPEPEAEPLVEEALLTCTEFRKGNKDLKGGIGGSRGTEGEGKRTKKVGRR